MKGTAASLLIPFVVFVIRSELNSVTMAPPSSHIPQEILDIFVRLSTQLQREVAHGHGTVNLTFSS